MRSKPAAGECQSKPGPTTTTAASAASDHPTCPNVSGRRSATEGALSVGSFRKNLLGPLRPGSPIRKLWVSSQRKGRDDAVIVITAPDGEKVTQTRESGMAFVRGAEQFYPGEIRAPMTGTYRIDVTVGSDTMCVKVDYRA